MNAAFNALSHAYAGRFDGSGDSGVIGTVGTEIPEEVILAAGLKPVRLFADGAKATPIADKYLENVFKKSEKALFEDIVTGKIGVKGIVFSNTADSEIKLYYYLREYARENGGNLPELILLDWRYDSCELNDAWNASELDAFIEAVEDLSGALVTEENLTKARALCRETELALARLDALRKAGKVTGTEYFIAAGCASFMDKAEVTAQINAICDALAEADAGVNKIMYIGTEPESEELFAALEKDGTVIADDDLPALTGVWEYADRGDTAREQILNRITARPPKAKHALTAVRAAYIKEKAEKAGVSTVVCYSGKGDDAIRWDVPSVKKALNGIELKVLKEADF